MKKIIETTQLEFNKSVFLIDLIKHDSGLLYIEILQTIFEDVNQAHSIKINPVILSDIIKVLQNYHAIIAKNTDVYSKHLTEDIQQKIQDRYLRGVSIKDLVLQFDQSKELIEMVLRNKGIQIDTIKIPQPRYWKKRR
jgi:hypothetical protein